MATDYQQVLDFWFGDGADAEIASRQSSLWWGKNPEVDCQIKRQFEGDLQALVDGQQPQWLESPQGRLAAIVVLDQFSRNMYRDSGQSFSQDGLALALCIEGIDRGVDKKLSPIQRVFFYMPLEHAESMDMQNLSVTAFERLHSEVPETDQKLFAGFVEFAEKHRVIIERFGRYPHRNKLLGRESTAEEVEFLKQPGSRF
ncbi:DUF924 domain-containing protein [bacterium SCSIO 12696]|nr:DUF924 domain-containing protein [bacterium SCSIO 12696]